MADFHLAVRPGTDAWCLAAMAAIIVQDNLAAHAWLAAHTTGYEQIAGPLRRIPVPEYAALCGVDEALLRRAAERIARARSVSMIEDLGVQMNRHSTLVSYLNRLVWLLAGHYGRPGTNNAFVPLLSLSSSGRNRPSQPAAQGGDKGAPRPGSHSPVTGAKVIIGLIPCNVIPDEILTDHPKRFRAMFIESANPVHSLADSPRMRESMRALDLSVVIDVAMTETAAQADYVLPAQSQFEKAEATFFNLEFPRNAFHLRPPLFEPRPGTLTEAEIHARLLEALGELNERHYRMLRRAARLGRAAFALAFAWKAARDKAMTAMPRWCCTARWERPCRPGWRPPHRCGASANSTCASSPKPRVAPASVARPRARPTACSRPSSTHLRGWCSPRANTTTAGPPCAGRATRSSSASSELCPSWRRWTAGFRRTIRPTLSCCRPASAAATPATPHPRRRLAPQRALRHAAHRPADAAALGCAEGDWVRLGTRRGDAPRRSRSHPTCGRGTCRCPTARASTTTAPTAPCGAWACGSTNSPAARDRDPIAGTPWHKHVRARLERLTSGAEAAG